MIISERWICNEGEEHEIRMITDRLDAIWVRVGDCAGISVRLSFSIIRYELFGAVKLIGDEGNKERMSKVL